MTTNRPAVVLLMGGQTDGHRTSNWIGLKIGDLTMRWQMGVLFVLLNTAPIPVAQGPPQGEADVTVPRLQDGFEGAKIANFWLPGNYGTGLHVPGSVVISKDHARSGNQSAKLMIREGFVDARGDDGKHVERTEIDSGHRPLLNRDVYYGFSLLIPKDFPLVTTRLVIANIKQSDVEASPLVGQRFQAGLHTLSIRPPGVEGGGQRHILPPVPLGRWFDMVYRVKYSEDKDGRIEIWMDGKSVVAYEGPTASRTGANRFYHKVGLYRDRLKVPMTLYVDNYSTGETFEAVDPAQFAKYR